MEMNRTLIPGQPPTNAPQFAMYLREQLGVSYGPGNRRSVFFSQVNDEMKINGWEWADLVATVKYIKDRKIKIRTPYGVLYFVNEAKEAAATVDSYDLISSVAEAISQETDPRWLQRLSLAKGKALERVYTEWRLQHAQV